MYLASNFGAEGDEKRRQGDDVHGVGDHEGAHDRVDWAEERHRQRQKPEHAYHGNAHEHPPQERLCRVYTHRLLAHQKHRVREQHEPHGLRAIHAQLISSIAWTFDFFHWSIIYAATKYLTQLIQATVDEHD